MGNFFDDNDDIQFYVDRFIDWRKVVERIEDFKHPDAPGSVQDAVDTYREILSLLGSFSADEIEPRAPAMDRAGTWMEDGVVKASPEHEEIFAALREMGVLGMCTPREVGGMNCPGILYLFISEMMSRGDVSTLGHFGFHIAPALAMLSYSILEGSTTFTEDGRIATTRWRAAVEEMARGEAWGSMDLTEPNAGSDLAALRTRAHQGDDGVWRVTGNKIFITSGHGKYHFVLAKTEDRESLRALSLFLVPLTLERDGKTIVNAVVDRVEHKLGHRSSPTCSVQFDESEAELVGKVGQGFELMLHLMNHARLGVGFESIGVAEAAYRTAKAYAAERQSMGSALDKHPMIRAWLDEMDLTLRGLRAMAVEAALSEEEAVHLEGMQKRFPDAVPNAADARRYRKLKRRVRHLTPLVKYLTSEESVRFCRLAMQIHGGNGYMLDYAPERLLRDALVLPVYEGTSQIQALMALKDNLGAITKHPQDFLRSLAATKLQAMTASDPLERSLRKLQSLSLSAQQHILWRVAKDKWADAVNGPIEEIFRRFTKNWNPKRDFAWGLLHAENLIRILSDVAVAESLYKQGQKFPERRDLAERWMELVEPRVRYHWELIHGSGDRLLAQLQREEDEAAQRIA